MSDNKTLKERLAPMTGKQRVSYLWTYYKWVVLAVILGSVLLVWIVQAVISANTKVVLNGTAVNVAMNETGREFFEEGALARYGTAGTRQKVTLETVILPQDTGYNSQELYNMQMRMGVQVASQMIDYFLLDQTAYDFYKQQNMFADLTTVLTQEQTEALSPYFVYSESEPAVPVAVDVSHLRFVQENVTGSRVLLALPGNTERTAQVLALIDDLLAW